MRLGKFPGGKIGAHIHAARIESFNRIHQRGNFEQVRQFPVTTPKQIKGM